MIYTITLNPSLDYHLTLDKLRPNQLNISDTSYLAEKALMWPLS